MVHLTWFSAILWFAVVFFGGITAQACFTGHRARHTLIHIYILILLVIVILMGLGNFAGLL